MTLCAASSSQNAYIDFAYPGTAAKGKLLYSNSLGAMTFTTNGTERMRIDNVGEVLIGSATSDGVHKLKVIGSAFISSITGTSSIGCSGAITTATLTTTGLISCQSLATAGSKNFDIPHPTKTDYRLRHRCLEGPLAYCVYPYQFQCVAGLNTFPLPDYFDALNKDVLVYVNPFRHFGSGWGESVGNNTLNITCSEDGLYNIQVVGTRNDPLMESVYLNEPVEYPDPNAATN